MVKPKDHLENKPDKRLTKQEAKEQVLHGVKESLNVNNLSKVGFNDKPAPNHSNADGKIEPDLPSGVVDSNVGKEYFDDP